MLFLCGSGTGSWIRNGNKWIRIQVISLLTFWSFLQKTIFKFFYFIFFSHIFILKLNESFRNENIFIKLQIWVLGVKTFFFCSFYPLDPDLWIRIFLWLRIQKAKILRIQQIWMRILSTGQPISLTFSWILHFKG